MHEWIRYRKQQVKQTDSEEEAAGEEADEATEESEAEAEAAPEVVDAEEAAEAEAVTGEAPAPDAGEETAEAESEAAPAESELTEESAPEEEEAQAAPEDAESTLTDREAVLSSLQEELDRAGASMKDRLSQLQARQKQLPMDVEEAETREEAGGSRKATETRQELVQRLLDPVLTLREAALLIDVCPTTVRRYTNRGLLNCFRTPGNQRRFHLSDILEFLERRERGEV